MNWILALGFFSAGFAVCAVIANRRPQWFAQVVKAGNAIDNAINQAASSAASKIKGS